MIANLSKKSPILFIILLFIFLTIIFTYPILASKNNLGIQDWDHQMAFLESARKTVLEYHQFPFWDAFHCGGMPALGNPQSGFVSVTFLLALMSGTITGVKLSLALHFFISFIGTYALSRYLKFSKKGSVAASIIFTCSGVISSALATGMLTFIYAAYLPLVALFILKSIKERGRIIQNIGLAGIFLGLTYYGGYHITIVTIPLIFIYIIIESFAAKSVRPVFVGMGIGLVFLLFCAPKLILNYNLMYSYPRYIEDNSGYTVKGLLYFLTSPVQNIQNNLLIKGGMDYNFGVDENSLYVGTIGFLLVLVGFIKSKPKFKMLFLVVLFLMLGYLLPISLFALLRKLPFYNEFRVAQRFRFPFMVILSLAAAKGMDFITSKIKNRYMSLIIIVTLFGDLLFFTHKNFFTQTFIVNNEWTSSTKIGNNSPKIIKTLDMSYSRSKNSQIYDDNDWMYTPWSIEYPEARQSLSHTECYETIPVLDNRTIESFEFLPNNIDHDITTIWTPNKIILNVKNFKDDHILVNQNFVKGWYAKNEVGSAREVSAFDGILNVEKLPEDISISLIYNPFKI